MKEQGYFVSKGGKQGSTSTSIVTIFASIDSYLSILEQLFLRTLRKERRLVLSPTSNVESNRFSIESGPRITPMLAGWNDDHLGDHRLHPLREELWDSRAWKLFKTII
jgi:hypothetical protein